MSEMKKLIYSETGFKGFNNVSLKIIICCTMLIDHIACTFIWDLYSNACIVNGVEIIGEGKPFDAVLFYSLYLSMRGIGRLAYPLACFLLVQGFLHTHSIIKYLLRILAFAIISEIPYDYAMSGKLFEYYNQNVLWTLFLGVVLMTGLNYIEKCSIYIRIVLYAIFTCMIMFLSLFISSDGKFFGILLISLLYIFRKRFGKYFIGAFLVFILQSILFWPIQLLAVFGIVLTKWYNGTLGRGNKYFFYVFYPTHLFLIGLIRNYIN